MPGRSLTRMRVFKRQRVLVTTLVGLAAAASMLLANAMAADTAQSKAVMDRGVSAPQAHSSCVIREGTSRTGVPTGSNPTRYRWSDASPYGLDGVYMGARYNSCTNKVVAYYGGITPESDRDFYHIRLTSGTQKEVSRGQARWFTFLAPGGSSTGILAQACLKPTRFFKPTVCGRWSPVVQLALE